MKMPPSSGIRFSDETMMYQKKCGERKEQPRIQNTPLRVKHGGGGVMYAHVWLSMERAQRCLLMIATVDRSSRRSSEVYGSILSAQLQMQQNR